MPHPHAPIREQLNPHCPSLSLGFLVCLSRDESSSTRLLGLMDTLRPWKMTARIPTAMAPQGETREGHYYTWLPGVISHFICRCGGNAGPREDVS